MALSLPWVTLFCCPRGTFQSFLCPEPPNHSRPGSPFFVGHEEPFSRSGDNKKGWLRAQSFFALGHPFCCPRITFQSNRYNGSFFALGHPFFVAHEEPFSRSDTVTTKKGWLRAQSFFALGHPTIVALSHPFVAHEEPCIRSDTVTTKKGGSGRSLSLHWVTLFVAHE